MRPHRFGVPISFLLAFAALGAGNQPKLEKRYQEWLTGPTSYLITKAEREAFERLTRDEERDTFIDRFWELRNPKPGSETNDFKEEFYRRVACANAQYGPKSGTDGWRTDMGRTYILFGKPQQSASFPQMHGLHPLEMWFYANPGLTELPPFFYVLFYEKDDISGYRLYHPYVDGPDKLVRDSTTKRQAYGYLRSINPEMARASLSLIPGEPVDTDTFTGSMESGVILNAIQGYREMPSYVALINQRRAMLERVTSQIHYDIAQASVLPFVAREQGETWLYWQLEIRDPLQPKAKDGRVKFDIKAQLYAGGKLIYERADAPQFAVPLQAAEALKRRPFVYEDRVAIGPGQYRLFVTARNEAADRQYEASKEFTVEGTSKDLALSDVLTIARFEPDARPRPFQFGGVKFTPASLVTATATRGLRILYQVSIPEPRPAALDVEYVVGGVANKFKKSFNEQLDTRQADAWGSLTTSKVLSLEELPPGAYQVVVRVKDPATGRVAARASPFRVAGEQDEIRPIVVTPSAPPPAVARRGGIPDAGGPGR